MSDIDKNKTVQEQIDSTSSCNPTETITPPTSATGTPASEQGNNRIKRSVFDYIEALFAPNATSSFHFAGRLEFIFPERQKHSHKITIRQIDLEAPGPRQDYKTLSIGLGEHGCQKFSLTLNAREGKWHIYAQNDDVVEKRPWIEALEENTPYQIGLQTKRPKTHPGVYYDDVMSYWFSDKLPDITITQEGGNDDNSQFNDLKDWLLQFWPKYESLNPKIIFTIDQSDLEDNTDSEIEQSDSENNAVPKNEMENATMIVAIILIAFLRKFIMNGMFYGLVTTNPFWEPASHYLFQNGKYTLASFTKKPDVDLNPIELEKYLVGKHLYFSPALLDTICAALNSGDNIILTGGPGCGKTTLAKEVIDFSDYNGIVTTASSAWTTDELIGRYMPKPYETSTVLFFQPGYFLEAIKSKKWLLIDEMNRAPIDLCFGELFTVLAEQSVELPFFGKEDEDGQNQGSAKRVWIVAKNDESKRANILPYKVDSSFRLLCTMNDVDKDKLEQLSFALQRRFHIIRMDSPSKKQVEKVIDDCWGKWAKNSDNGLQSIFGDITKPEKNLETLFYNGKPKSNDQKPDDLLSLHVINIAQVLDIIKFALWRCYVSKVSYKKNLYEDINVNHYILTGLALGIVTKVYPQLQNPLLNDGNIKSVIELLVDAFGKDAQGQKPQMVFTSDSNQNPKTILEYLQEEFEVQFKNIAPKYSAVWSSQQGTTR